MMEINGENISLTATIGSDLYFQRLMGRFMWVHKMRLAIYGPMIRVNIRITL